MSEDKTVNQDQGANDDDAAQNDAAPADNAADNGAGDGNDAPAVYLPEGLPEHMGGKTNQEVIDKLFKAYDGARKELSKQSKVPENIDEYKIELPEELASQVIKAGDDGTDPIFEDMRKIMHENGIPSDKALNIISGFYEKVAAQMSGAQNDNGSDKGESAVGLDFEFKSYGGPEKAKPVIDANQAWINGLVNQGIVSKEDAADMASNLAVTEGLQWMDKLRISLGGGAPIPADMKGSNGGNEITKESLDARVADPRYQVGNPKFDKAFYDETTKQFQQFYNKQA